MQEASERPPVQRIAEVVGAQFHISPARIFDKNRKNKTLNEARQLVAFLARDVYGMSFPEIAASLGYTQHATAMRSVQAFEKKSATDARLRSRRDEAQTVLRLGAEHHKREHVVVVFSSGVRDRLTALVDSGCFGRGVSEAVERIVSAYVYENVGEIRLEVGE
jgi:hypothetical protein